MSQTMATARLEARISTELHAILKRPCQTHNTLSL